MAQAEPRRAQEIFAATLELLAEHGYDRLAIESVASRAGVNKTTIYRWWPSKDALLAAALLNSTVLEFPIPDTGGLRGDLLAMASGIARLLTRPPTAQLAAVALTAIPGRPTLAATASAFFADRLAREQPIFQRAVRRGELADATSGAMIMDLLGGALWFHILIRSGSANRRYLTTLVDTVLDGIAAGR